MNSVKVATIDSQELKKLLTTDPELCLIDVRELAEWQSGYIPGAIHIPLSELTNKITAQVSNITQPIFLYCKAGVRSFMAAQQLLFLGYEKVYSVDGGIDGWIQQNYVIYK